MVLLYPTWPTPPRRTHLQKKKYSAMIGSIQCGIRDTDGFECIVERSAAPLQSSIFTVHLLVISINSTITGLMAQWQGA
jgi:hypothetical protein